MKPFIYTALCASALLSACDTGKQVAKETAENVSNDLIGETIDIEYINSSVRPQDDFFEFSNGSWLKNNPVPASESRWGSFNELDQSNKAKLKTILENAQKANASKGDMNQILGDYYSSFMDMERRNSLGVTAIEDELNAVKQINSKKDLPGIIAKHHRLGINSLFGYGVGQDLKNVSEHITYFGQGGIGLPNRDYYFQEDKAEILKKYQRHIKEMMMIMDYSSEEASAFAESVVQFETSIAESMMAPAELRSPEKTYNKYGRINFIKQFNDFDMEGYMQAVGSQSFDTLIVSQPNHIGLISKTVKNTDLDDWKNYLTWKVLDHYAGHLNQQFVDKNFEFYGQALKGTKEMKPDTDRAIEEITNSVFAELLGKAFVKDNYSESAKKRVNTMVDNLLIVFQDRINNLEWMSEDTKKEALIKLNSIGRKLGYPSVWEDFSSLSFTKENYIENLRESARYAHNKNMKKLNEPVDKNEWGMPAHMVNAYYHPLLNEIAFPAGIMQAPFFSDSYEDAVNYGRIGMVIGHEFTHGFDDMGSKFAADGTFRNWWTENDRKLFEERTGKLGSTFSGFCPIDGHCVNPELTMGENIADLGGLTLAYYAYTKTAEYKSGVKRNGYTPAQRFFIGYAQLWKINYTDEELKNRIANDPHSPGMYRVNGPLMNCPEFFEAFDVKEEDKMRNSDEEISKIW